MLENKYKQMTISEHISLYDKIIPKDNFLRKLKENIDFSFVNKLLEKERYKIEAKNAETKLTHGLIRARSVGLLNMRIQSYITHIVKNIKRIMRKIDDNMAIE